MAAQRDVVAIHRQIIEAREAVEIERARDVQAARDDVRLLLGQHGLFNASFAVRCDPTGSFLEFRRMNCAMRAGGYHRVRLTGGRTIDG